MRKYEVVLAFDMPNNEANRFEVEADGIGYHNDEADVVMVLYVIDKPEQTDSKVDQRGFERPVFALPVRAVAYVREIPELTLQRRVDELQGALDRIEDLEPVTFKGGEHMGVPDGDYLPRAAVAEIIASTI